MGRLSMIECTYLPTYLHIAAVLIGDTIFRFGLIVHVSTVLGVC